MSERAERSAEALELEAEAVASGRIPPAEFIASLDWSLPGIIRRAGGYAPQAGVLIQDALDRIAFGEATTDEDAVRALAAATAILARAPDDPTSVGRVHSKLTGARLLPSGPPPEPRPVSPAGRRSDDPRPEPAGENSAATAAPPLDPALDPEVTRLAQRFAPSRGFMASMAVLGLGWAVVLSLVAGIFVGIWLDGLLNTGPLMTIIGLVFGLALAGMSVRSLIRRSRAR